MSECVGVYVCAIYEANYSFWCQTLLQQQRRHKKGFANLEKIMRFPVEHL